MTEEESSLSLQTDLIDLRDVATTTKKTSLLDYHFGPDASNRVVHVSRIDFPLLLPPLLPSSQFNIVEVRFVDSFRDLLLVNVYGLLLSLGFTQNQVTWQLTRLSSRHKCTLGVLRQYISPAFHEQLAGLQPMCSWFVDLTGFSAVMLSLSQPTSDSTDLRRRSRKRSASSSSTTITTNIAIDVDQLGPLVLEKVNEFLLSQKLTEMSLTKPVAVDTVTPSSPRPLPEYNALLLLLLESRNTIARKSHEILQLRHTVDGMRAKVAAAQHRMARVRKEGQMAKVEAERWVGRRDRLLAIYDFCVDDLLDTLSHK